MVFQACEYFFSFATHKDTTSLYHLVDGRALAIRPFKREVQWDFSTTFAKMAKRLHLWICVSLRLMQHGNHWLVVKPIQDNTYSTIIYIYIYTRNYIEIIPVCTDTCLPVVCLTWAVQPPNTMRFAFTFQPFASKFQMLHLHPTTPLKINMTMEKPTVWRCTRICYQKWWFSS